MEAKKVRELHASIIFQQLQQSKEQIQMTDDQIKLEENQITATTKMKTTF